MTITTVALPFTTFRRFVLLCNHSSQQTYKLASPYLFLQTFIPYCWIPPIHCPPSKSKGFHTSPQNPLFRPPDPSRTNEPIYHPPNSPIRKPTRNPSTTHNPQPTITPNAQPLTRLPKTMCQLLITHYSACPHIDHIPGAQHEMPIYCAHIEFVEAGLSTEHQVCWMCRYPAGKGGQVVAANGGREVKREENRKEHEKGRGEPGGKST